MTTGRMGVVATTGALVLALAGCGGDDDDGGGGSTADAALPDAAPPDAAALFDAAPLADAAVDAASPPIDGGAASSSRLVISALRVPEPGTQALDIDGDGFGDNALGSYWRTLGDSTGLVAQEQFDQALAGGASLELLAVTSAASDTLRAFVGRDLDADPSDNFSGEEPLAIAPGTPIDGNLPATAGDVSLVAGPGDIPLRMPLSGQSPQLITMRSLGTRIAATVGEGGALDGQLGGAFLIQDVNALVIPPLATAWNQVIFRDCPGGPSSCAEGSPGEALLSIFDLDSDGVLTSSELRDNLVIQESLLNPDLDLFDADGAFNPNTDGINDSLSYGLGFGSVTASFLLPGEPPPAP